MSDQVLSLIVTTLGGIISLLLTLVFRRLGSVQKKVDNVTASAVVVAEKLDVVHTTVNHSRDENLKEIAALKREVHRLNNGGPFTPHVDTNVRADASEVTMVDGMADVKDRRAKP